MGGVPQRILVAALALMAVSGCAGSGAEPVGKDNSAEVCVEVREVMDRHLGNRTPEARAYTERLAAYYEGDSAAAAELPGLRAAHVAAWTAELTRLAERATDQPLRAALTGQAETLRDPGASADAMAAVRAYQPVRDACQAFWPAETAGTELPGTVPSGTG